MAPWPDAAVVAAGAIAVLSHVRARRSCRRRPVRLALESVDPEVRRAAVLVAKCDGVARHLRMLSARTRTETDETVLDALELAVQGRRRRLGRRRRGAQLPLSADMRVPSRATSDDASPSSSQLPAPTWQIIDALEVMEAAVPMGLAKAASEPSLEPVRSAWRTPPRLIDALEVVDVVARRAGEAPAGDSQSRRRRRTRGSWRAGPDEIDALVAADLTGGDAQSRSPSPRRATTERSAASR